MAVRVAGVIVMSCLPILIRQPQRDIIYSKWRIWSMQKRNWRHAALWKQITNHYSLLNLFYTFCSSFNYHDLLSISRFCILNRASAVWGSKRNSRNTFKFYKPLSVGFEGIFSSVKAYRRSVIVGLMLRGFLEKMICLVSHTSVISLLFLYDQYYLKSSA